jgi:hypothetical protein
VIGGRQRFGMIAAVSLRLMYLIFQHMLGLILLTGRPLSSGTSAAAIVSLLHISDNRQYA